MQAHWAQKLCSKSSRKLERLVTQVRHKADYTVLLGSSPSFDNVSTTAGEM